MKTHLLILLILFAVTTAFGRLTNTFTGATITTDQFQQEFVKLAGIKKRILAPENRDRAIVCYDALQGVMEDCWRTMSSRYGMKVTRSGPVWDQRFDCVAIDISFNLELRSRLFREYWMSRSGVRRPAAIMVLFKQDRLIVGNDINHAVMFIVTDRGPVFWDPSVGPVTLSQSEIDSIYFFTP